MLEIKLMFHQVCHLNSKKINQICICRFLLILYLLCAGTVIDNTVCHPKNNDFYLCAQAGMIVSTIFNVKFVSFLA